MEDSRRQRVTRQRFSKSSARLFPIEPPHGGRDAGAAVGWLTGEDGLAKHEALDRYFARSPELFGIGTWDGLILKVNAAWQRTLGYTAEELALTSFWDRVHPEALSTCRGAVRALARAGTADSRSGCHTRTAATAGFPGASWPPRGGSSPSAATSPSGGGPKGRWRRPRRRGTRSPYPVSSWPRTTATPSAL